MTSIYWSRRRAKAESPSPTPRIRLVVGLGNPGPEYRNTRHNAGFLVLEHLAGLHGVTLRAGRFGESAEMPQGDRRVFLLKPNTFMNLSGQAVAPFARHKGIVPASILVVSDDLDLPVGTVRVRDKGSSGGHNGLKSCIASLGTEAFPRVRVGIGRPEPGQDVVDFVLGIPHGEARDRFFEAVAQAARLVDEALAGRLPVGTYGADG